MGGAFATAFMIVIPAVFFAIIAGIIMHSLIGRLITGDISGIEAVLIIGVYAGMIISIVTMKLVLAAVLLVILVGLLVLPQLQGKRTVRTMYDEQIEQFRTAIESDPQNLAARSRLAETLYKKGHLDEAIAEMSEVVRLSPQSRNEAYKLEQYHRERDERAAPPRKCPSCGLSNPAGRTTCYSCEASLNISTELVKWLRGGGMRQIVIMWAITIGVLTVLTAGLSMLSVVVRVVTVCSLLIVVLIYTLVRLHLNSQ